MKTESMTPRQIVERCIGKAVGRPHGAKVYYVRGIGHRGVILEKKHYTNPMDQFTTVSFGELRKMVLVDPVTGLELTEQ